MTQEPHADDFVQQMLQEFTNSTDDDSTEYIDPVDSAELDADRGSSEPREDDDSDNFVNMSAHGAAQENFLNSFFGSDDDELPQDSAPRSETTGAVDVWDDDHDVSDHETRHTSTVAEPIVEVSGAHADGETGSADSGADDDTDDTDFVDDDLDGSADSVAQSQKDRYVDAGAEMNRPVVETYTPRENRSESSTAVSEHGVSSVPTDDRTPREKWRGETPQPRAYRWERDTGTMSESESEFYRNAGVFAQQARYQRGPVDALRGPVVLSETPAQRRRRIRQVTTVVYGRDAYRKNSSVAFTQKDQDTIEFIAMFRFAKASHIANIHSVRVDTAQKRLEKLRDRGLVIDMELPGTENLWFLTEPGVAVSGYDVKKADSTRYNYNVYPHYFGINHVASNLWGGNLDLLREPGFPFMNRRDREGNPMLGEELVSEYLIQSAFGRVTTMAKFEEYRHELVSSIDRKFEQWERSGGTEFGPSPELIQGNEHMMVMIPPRSVNHAYHVPDLVVKRDRNADGTPESIAVEIELANKSEESYCKALQSFYHDRRIFKKVVWVCRRPSTARKLTEIGADIGLIQERRLEVVPFFTDEGSFKGKSFWQI